MEFKKVSFKTLYDFENKYGKNLLSTLDKISQGDTLEIKPLVEILSVLIDEDPIQFLDNNCDKLEEIFEGISKAFTEGSLAKMSQTPIK
jgi:hypothetical protein